MALLLYSGQKWKAFIFLLPPPASSTSFFLFSSLSVFKSGEIWRERVRFICDSVNLLKGKDGTKSMNFSRKLFRVIVVVAVVK